MEARKIGEFVVKHNALPECVVGEPKLVTTKPGHYVVVMSAKFNTAYVIRTDSEGNTRMDVLTRNHNGGYTTGGVNVGTISTFCEGYQPYKISSQTVTISDSKAALTSKDGVVQPIRGAWGKIDCFNKEIWVTLWWTGGSWVSDKGVHPFRHFDTEGHV